MKKIIVICIIVMTLATMFVGCGKEEVAAEEIQTVIYEDIIYEDVIQEETILEEIIEEETVEEETINETIEERDGWSWGVTPSGNTVYASPEYWAEVGYNSQENGW